MIQKRMPSLLTLAATTLVALSAATQAEAQQCGSVGPTSRCTVGVHNGLNVANFARDISDGMAGLAVPPKGYAMAFYAQNGSWTPILTLSRGLASGTTDPIFDFTPTVGSALASVSKVFTESAVRHAIEVNNETGARSACRVTAQTRFLTFLPDAFIRAAAAGGGIAGLSVYINPTIDDLLRHKAGIPNNLTRLPDGTYDYYEMMVRPRSKQTCPVGVACYSNENYVVATTMLPLILDCSLRATFEAEATAQCANQTEGKNRDSCQIQYAFTRLGNMSNSILQGMIMDVLSSRASCWPQVLIDGGTSVARGYANSTAQSGAYIQPGSDVRGCGVGGWHMPSEDLGRFLKRFWHGSFFNHASTSNAITGDQNGGLNGYSSWAYKIVDTRANGDGLSMAMLANSPTEAWNIKPFVDRAFTNNQIALNAAPVDLINTSRGNWDCVQDGTTNRLTMRISNPVDIKLFNGFDYNGQGSEENWGTTANGADVASGAYSFYRATSSPLTTQIFPGRWTLRRSGVKRTMTRVDNATGWTGNYTCTRLAD